MTALRDALTPLIDQCADPPVTLGGVVAAARPLAVALLALKAGAPMLCLTASRAEAERLTDDLAVFLGPPPPLRAVDEVRRQPYGLLLPDREVSMFDEGATDAERLQALYDLAGRQPVVLVAPLLALLQTACDVTTLRPLLLRRGDDFEPQEAADALHRLGYAAAPIVRAPGQYVAHGGVFDVFPSNGHPLRAYLREGRIEDLRAFDAQSQRTTGEVDSAAVLPMREPGGDVDIRHLLPAGAPIVVCEPQAVAARLAEMQEGRERTADDRFSACKGLPLLDEGDPWKALQARLGDHFSLTAQHATPDLQSAEVERFGGLLADFSRHAETLERAFVVTRQARRVATIMERRGLQHVTVVEGELSQGVRVGDVEIYSDLEIFGHARRARWEPTADTLAPDLREGDVVVHEERGIGRYDGLVTVEVEGTPRDLLQITYADDDRLMVPVHQIDQVSRYVGDEDKMPSLSKLGKPAWQKTCGRVRAALAEAAAHLLEQGRARQARRARAFGRDSARQEELEASFPYDETPHQKAAAAAIKADMERDVAMDRLLCGDVGYGKTEIAVRAAFKAVDNGAQVAVLVPTTVLAQQHELTFRQRMHAFGVRVEALVSGTPGEAELLGRIRDGQVDVVIGTHRLLSDDVVIPHLALVVVDEEQQFGLSHKEKLREMSDGVHTLTMTATPIPRTMQLSLAGVRDVSLLETPPEARRPVRTWLLEDSLSVCRAAIVRELERNGQVFLLHNRVQGLARLAGQVRRVVAGARVVMAHGQMADRELEEVLSAFAAREHDVLVCTTIIESGIDIPDANTILVKDAHTLGLGQLYQIRGRVGRSDRQAFCYLLHPGGRRLSAKARARLETIRSMTALGSGSAIALRDLEIRGAGDLLGEAQAGHVGRVGFTLFCKMLDEALARARGESTESDDVPPPQVPVGAWVPGAFVRDSAQRVAIYRRLAQLRGSDARRALADELRDRYGPLPGPLEKLLREAEP